MHVEGQLRTMDCRTEHSKTNVLTVLHTLYLAKTVSCPP